MCSVILTAEAQPSPASFEELVRNVLGAYRAIERLRLDIRCSDPDGIHTSTLHLSRPDRLSVRFSAYKAGEGEGEMQLTADGPRIYYYNFKDANYRRIIWEADDRDQFHHDVTGLGRCFPVGPNLFVLTAMQPVSCEEIMWTMDKLFLRGIRTIGQASNESGFFVIEIAPKIQKTGNTSGGETFKIYIDPKSYLVTRVVAVNDGKTTAFTELTYSIEKNIPNEVFQFIPPPNSREIPSTRAPFDNELR